MIPRAGTVMVESVFPTLLAVLAAATLASGCPKPGPADSGRSGTGMVEPPKPIVLPPVHTEVLENGLEVLFVENHEIPTVTLTVLWKNGAEIDPPDQVGITSMVAALLRQGTKTRSADEIAEAIDFIGGDLGGSADLDSAEVSVQVLKKDLETGIDLLADVARRPSFPEAEVALLKRQETAGVRQVFDDPGELARRHVRVLLLGEEHPYAFATSERSIASIDREALVAHYETWFGPGNAVLGIAGDVRPDEAMPAIQAAFGSWRGGAAPKVVFPESPDARRAVRLVDKPDLSQSSIRLALPGIDRKSPDYYAAVVMNYVLGGGSFSSRLVRVVRSDEGKTYGIGSGFTIRKRPALFGIATSTRNAETVATLDLIAREIDKIRTEGTGVTPEELAAAKSNIVGRYPRQFETATDVLSRILLARLHGLPMTEITGYRRRIAEVTLEQVNAAARTYLDPEQTAIVVVGRSAEVKGPLEARFGTIEVVDYLEPTHRIDAPPGAENRPGGAN